MSGMLYLDNFVSSEHDAVGQGIALSVGEGNLRKTQAMGTVELTGLEMIKRQALGQASAQAATKFLTMLAAGMQ
eukprot:758314-Hanusia_phi.AAC.9